MTERTIIHDVESKQFHLPVEGQFATIEYTKENGDFLLLHARTPMELRGKGIGKELVEKTINHIESHGGNVVAICSFIRSVVSENNKLKNSVS